MAEQTISLHYDDSEARAAVSRVNKGIESNEQAADRAGAAIVRSTDAKTAALVRLTEKSRLSINRTTQQVQAKAALAEADTPLKRLAFEKGRDLSRVAGDRKAVDEVTEAYDRLIAKQKQADRVASFKQTQAGLSAAAKAADDFEESLQHANRQLDQAKARRDEEVARKYELATRQAASAIRERIAAQERSNAVAAKARLINEDQVRSLEKRAATRVATGVEQLLGERRDFLANFKGDTAQIDRAKAAFDRLIDAEKKAEAQASSLEKRFRNVGDTFSSIGQRLTFAVTLPLAAGATAATFLFGKLEQARIGFTTMLGSAQAADQFLRKLADFAQRTPFEFAELVPMAQRLRALGFEAKEVIPILGLVGNAVSGLAGGSDLIGRITLALGQMQAKGKVSHEEVRQLAEAGIPVWETLAKRIGVSVPQAMKMAENGAISAAVGIPAILGDMMKRFGGLMEQQNRTTLGQFSNLKDKLGFLAVDIGRVLDPVAQGILRFANNTVGFLKRLVEQFSLLPGWVQKATIALVGFIAVAGPTAQAIGGISRALAFLYGAQLAGSITNIAVLGSGFKGLAAFATGTVGPLTLMATRLLFLGKAALVVAAAFTGWKIGDMLSNLFDTERAAERAAQKLEKLALAQNAFAANKLFENLKAKGIVIKQNGMAVEDWVAQMQLARETLEALDNMTKRGAGQPDTARLEKVIQAEKAARDFREQSIRQELEGIARVEQVRREQLRDHGLTAKARNDIEVGAAALRQKVAEDAEKKAQTFRDAAVARELTGLGKIQEQRRQAIAELDRQGLSTEQKAKSLGLIDEATLALAAKYNDDLLKLAQAFFNESARGASEGFDRIAELRRENLEKFKENAAALEVVNRAILLREQKLTNELAQEMERRVSQRELATLDAQKDQELRGIQLLEAQQIRLSDTSSARTLAAKVQLEQRKSAIEQEFLLKRATIETDIIHKRAFAAAKLAESDQQKNKILSDASQDALDIEQRALAQLDASRENATIRTAELIRDQQQRIFDSIRQSAEGLFDSMLQGAKSFGDALKRVMLAALLTPIKQAFSNAVATMLTGLKTAQSNAVSPGGTAGGLFGKIGLSTLFGGSGGFSLPGAPGGTPGFAGPVRLGATAAASVPSFAGQISGGGAAAAGGSSAVQAAGFAGQFAGIKQSLAQLGNIGFKAGGKGVGGAAGGGLLLGGGALAFDGLRRGGKLGLAETTAGGALIGFKFGGPLGAAIGAGAGAVAGTIRLFIKGAQEKITERVRSIYGVSISKDFARDPLLGIIKQNFGGNLEVGLRSPQVRELIELYAMSTGQERGGALAPITKPSQFTQRAGVITQQATFSNATQVTAARTVKAALAPVATNLPEPKVDVANIERAQVKFEFDRSTLADVTEKQLTASRTATIGVLEQQIEKSNNATLKGMRQVRAGISEPAPLATAAQIETAPITAKQKIFETSRTAAANQVQERLAGTNATVLDSIQGQFDNSHTSTTAGLQRLLSSVGSSGIAAPVARFETDAIALSQKRFETDRASAVTQFQQRLEAGHVGAAKRLQVQIEAARKGVGSLQRVAGVIDTARIAPLVIEPLDTGALVTAQKQFELERASAVGQVQERFQAHEATIMGDLRTRLDTTREKAMGDVGSILSSIGSPGIADPSQRGIASAGTFENASLSLPKTVQASPLAAAPVSAPSNLAEVSTALVESMVKAFTAQPVQFGMAQISINGDAATAALEGRIAPVVARSPEAVSTAQLRASRNSTNRRQQTALTLAPGVITG